MNRSTVESEEAFIVSAVVKNIVNVERAIDEAHFVGIIYGSLFATLSNNNISDPLFNDFFNARNAKSWGPNKFSLASPLSAVTPIHLLLSNRELGRSNRQFSSGKVDDDRFSINKLC